MEEEMESEERTEGGREGESKGLLKEESEGAEMRGEERRVKE